MKLCPFCDGQGVIHKATIKKDETVIYICGECDTVWLTEDFEPEKCVRFDELMPNKGLKPLWSELNDVSEL